MGSGGNPLIAGTAQLPFVQIRGDETLLVLYYRLKRDLVDVIVMPQSAEELPDWIDEPGLTPVMVAGESDDETDLWYVSKSIDLRDRLFLRLWAGLPD